MLTDDQDLTNGKFDKKPSVRPVTEPMKRLDELGRRNAEKCAAAGLRVFLPPSDRFVDVGHRQN